jgi:hypothetical protein
VGHLLPLIKYLFSRNVYVCPVWIFIFDTDQAQINSAAGKLFMKEWLMTFEQKKKHNDWYYFD